MVQIDISDNFIGFVFGVITTLTLMFVIKHLNIETCDAYLNTLMGEESFSNEISSMERLEENEKNKTNLVQNQEKSSIPENIIKEKNVSIDEGINENDFFNILENENKRKQGQNRIENIRKERKLYYELKLEELMKEKTSLLEVSGNQRYATLDALEKANEDYDRKVNSVIISFEEERSRLEYIKSLNLIGKKFYSFDKSNGKNTKTVSGYSLHPVYINKGKNSARTYNSKVVGVAIDDKYFTQKLCNNPTDKAIITAIVDIGGIDEFDRGYEGFQF